MVVGAVKTYLLAPAVSKEKIQIARPRPSDVKLVSLNHRPLTHEGP